MGVCAHAGFDAQGRRYSLLQYVLRETEQLHAKLRRYTSPDEHSFFEVAAPLVGLVCKLSWLCVRARGHVSWIVVPMLSADAYVF